jgi:hypothetical protein
VILGGDLLAHRVEQLVRGAPVAPARVHARVDLVVDPGDADHEELVQVGRVDRRELHPFHERDGRVLGELQHAVVERQPGDLRLV